ncbi:hypothetical protein HY546_01905 [archaeon]|nr:hypothetical protein [archaeon]
MAMMTMSVRLYCKALLRHDLVCKHARLGRLFFIALLLVLASAPAFSWLNEPYVSGPDLRNGQYTYYNYTDRPHYEYYVRPLTGNWDRDADGNLLKAKQMPQYEWPYGVSSNYSTEYSGIFGGGSSVKTYTKTVWIEDWQYSLAEGWQDKGRWENITITMPAGSTEITQIGYGWRFGYYYDYRYAYENRPTVEKVWVEDGYWEWVESGYFYYCSGSWSCRPNDYGYYYTRRPDGSLHWKWCCTTSGFLEGDWLDYQVNVGLGGISFFTKWGWSYVDRSYYLWHDTPHWENQSIDHWNLYREEGAGWGFHPINEGWNMINGTGTVAYAEAPPVPPVQDNPIPINSSAGAYPFTLAPFNPAGGSARPFSTTGGAPGAGGGNAPLFPGAAAAATSAAAAGLFIGIRNINQHITRPFKQQQASPVSSILNGPVLQAAGAAQQSSNVNVMSFASRTIPLLLGPAPSATEPTVQVSTFWQSLVYNYSKLDNLESQVANVPDRTMSKEKGLSLTADVLGLERANVLISYQMYEPAWNQILHPRWETAIGFDLPGGRESVPQRMAEREQLLQRIGALEHEIGYKTGEFDRAYELSDKMSQAGFALSITGAAVTVSSAGLLLPVGGAMIGAGRILTFSSGTLDFLVGGSRIFDGTADARDWARFVMSPLSVAVYSKAGILESFKSITSDEGARMIEKSITKKAIKTVGKETVEYASSGLATQLLEEGITRLQPSGALGGGGLGAYHPLSSLPGRGPLNPLSSLYGMGRFNIALDLAVKQMMSKQTTNVDLHVNLPFYPQPENQQVTYAPRSDGGLDLSINSGASSSLLSSLLSQDRARNTRRSYSSVEQRYARPIGESTSVQEIKSPARPGGYVYYGASKTSVPAGKSNYGPSTGLVYYGESQTPIRAEKSNYGPSRGYVSYNGGTFTPAQKSSYGQSQKR